MLSPVSEPKKKAAAPKTVKVDAEKKEAEKKPRSKKANSAE
jgi:hypothetical protein